MSFFSSESKKQKNNQIQLQNIVLDINEKKLQVSEEFLNQMTKIYISKHLKVINENIADINKVTNIGLLFKKYDLIMAHIDKLITIEGLYNFRHPKPSEYKESLENKLDSYIMYLISREWRKAGPQNNSNLPAGEQLRKCEYFFSTFDKYLDRMPEESLSTLNQLKDSVRNPPQDEAPANEPVPEVQPPADDGFIPEEFETIETMPEEEELPPAEGQEQ